MIMTTVQSVEMLREFSTTKRNRVFLNAQPENKPIATKDKATDTTPAADLQQALILCLKSWCESCSAHGFGHMVSAQQNWLRIVWCLAILAVTIYCIINLVNSTATYISQATTTSTTNIRQIKQEFPEVSICNTNVFNTGNNATNAYLESILSDNGISSPLNASTDPSYEVMNGAIAALKGTLNHRYSTGNITPSFLYSLGFTVEDMIVSCRFNQAPCSTSQFIHHYTYKYGNCYSFNDLKDASGNNVNAKSTWAGKRHSLELELFTGIPGVQDKYSQDRGYVILLNNRSEIPSELGGFHVPTGRRTDLALTRTYYNSISTRSYPCRSNLTMLETDSIYYKYTVKLGRGYTHRACHDVYIQLNIMIQNCGCLDPDLVANYNLASIFNKNICATISEQDCIESQLPKILNIEVAYSDCPIECSTEWYQVKMDSTSFPSQSYLSLLETDPDVMSRVGAESSRIKDSFLKVSVYYEFPWYINIETSLVMTTDTYIALIGGILGLCIGMSFISFGEVILLIVNILKILLGWLYNKYKMKEGTKKEEFAAGN